MSKIISYTKRLDLNKLKTNKRVVSFAGVTTGGGSDHNPVTLGSPSNGLSIANQVLTLATATTSLAGAMSVADKQNLNALVAGAHSAVTINPTTPNGLSVDSNQQISLALATTNNAGAMSAQDKTDLGYGVMAYGWGDHSTMGYLDYNDPAADITSQQITEWDAAYQVAHQKVTIGANGNGLSVNSTTQEMNLALATTSNAGAMSATDKNKINNALVSGDNLFTLKNSDVDVGEPISQGGSLVIKAGDNVTVDRTDNELTIDAIFNGLISINGGTGIDVTGSGNSRTISAKIDNDTIIIDELNNQMMVDSSKVALQTDLHNAVTIGASANGLSIANQVLTLGLASSLNAGAMSVAQFNKLTAIASNADNYQNWKLSDGTFGSSENIGSGDVVTFLGSGGATVSRSDKTITIDTPVGHSPVSLGANQNGLSINGQVLQLAAATTSNNGALIASDKVKLNNLNTMANEAKGTGNDQFRTNLQNDNRFAYKIHTHNNVIPNNIFEIPAFIEGTYHTLNLHHHNRGSFSTRALTANNLYTMPFVIWGDKNLVIDEIGIEVTTAASTSGNAIIYIFESTDGKPDALLDSVIVTGLNSTGFKSAAIDFTFNKSQLYWIGVNPEVNFTTRAIGVAYAMSFGLSSATSTTTYISLLKSFTYGGRPITEYGTWNNSERSTLAPIAVKFKAANLVTIPNTPTSVTLVNSAEPYTVDGSWDSMSGATSYLVDYRVNGGTIYQDERYTNAWSFGGYSSGDYVEIRVASKNSGGTSAFSGWAAVYVN